MSHRKEPPDPEPEDPPLPPALTAFVKLAGGPGHELKAYRMWADARRAWRRATGRLLPDDLGPTGPVGDRVVPAPESAKTAHR